MNRIKSAVLGALAGWSGRPIKLTDGRFWTSYFGSENRAGVSVNEFSTLQLSAAWACVRLISQTISTLPFALYRRRPSGRTLADDHQVYELLHTQPNEDMTATVFWQTFLTSQLLHGVTYCEKNMSGRTITSIDFLPVGSVTEKPDGSWEVLTENNKVRRVPRENQWKTIAFTLDGVTPCSPIRYGAQVLGSSIAGENAAADMFRNGLKSPGVISMDVQNFKEGQREQIATHVKAASDNGRVMVLEKNASFSALQMHPDDAELLSSRKFSVEEVCRWFLVPPFMVGHSEKSTSWGTGIEQQMIGFITFVLRPWCVRIEASIRKDLLSVEERSKCAAEFNMEGLLRGDSAARATFYSTMTQNGIMTRDECLVTENLPAMGGNAEILTVQTALAPLDKLGENTATTTPTDDEPPA